MEKPGLRFHPSLREIQCYTITIADIAITLHPYKVVYIPHLRTLLIADVHIGKVSHFRKNGLAIPAGIIDTNFLRLNHCMDYFNPDEIYFLGDLFHSKWNNEFESFKEWRKKWPSVRMHLLPGNHEILAEHEYESLGLEMCTKSKTLGPLQLSHEPVDGNLYNLCGHLHPGISLNGKGRQHLRLPCFYFDHKRGILPSFGVFTGMHVIQPQKGYPLYAIDGDQLFPLHYAIT